MQKTQKKRMTLILAIALAAVLAIGSTLAYLAATTDQYNNAFSFAENVQGRLDEPNWRGPDHPDGPSGTNLTPGFEEAKDPMITNTSDNGINEFTAIRVTFTAGEAAATPSLELTDAETARLLRMITIDWNTDDWELVAGTNDPFDDDATNNQIWQYKNEIAPGETTNPLFSTVTINQNFSQSQADAAKAALADPTEYDGLTAAEIFNAEYAWLSGIIATHTESCFDYGACDCGTTDVLHHKNCTTPTAAHPCANCESVLINHTPADKSAMPPVAGCPFVTGTLKADCGCVAPAGAINGYTIVVKGAVVQAGAEGGIATFADATAPLVELFASNPPEAPVVTLP